MEVDQEPEFSDDLPFPPEELLSSKLPKGTIASQTQSILFNRIPTELRLRIFEYACTSNDRLEYPVRRCALHHRPGYEYYKHTWTDLLGTCRRIYLETYLLLAAMNEHVFWCCNGPDPNRACRGFETKYDYLAYKTYFKLQTQEQKDAVRELHFFTQQYWLDMPGYGIKLANDETCWARASSDLAVQCRPKKIKITFRHRDWWSWSEDLSSDEKLGIHPFRLGRAMWRDMDLPAVPEKKAPHAWGYQFKKFQSLQELEIEFETIETKSKQLDAVVQHALAWKFDLGDGRLLTTEGLPVVQSRWQGLGDKHMAFPAPPEEVPVVVERGGGRASPSFDENWTPGTQQGDTEQAGVEIPEGGSASQEPQAQESDEGVFGSEPEEVDASVIQFVTPVPTGEDEEDARESPSLASLSRESSLDEHDHLADLREIRQPYRSTFDPTRIERQDYYVISVRWKARTK